MDETEVAGALPTASKREAVGAAFGPPVAREALRVARALGLRIKEAVMIQPRLAEWPAGDMGDPSGFVGALSR